MCEERNKSCAITSNYRVHQCLPGKKPYYTLIGKYNDIIDVSEKLETLRTLQESKIYTIIDPQDPDYMNSDQYINPITLENIENKTINVAGGQTYYVSNITPEMNYLEMRKDGDPELKWFMLSQSNQNNYTNKSGYLVRGNNTNILEKSSVADAKIECSENTECGGITYQTSYDTNPENIWLKKTGTALAPSSEWTTWQKKENV
ncbi:MAG TPA: hypothetical protein EYO59_11945 [Chromatiaceae bacterium]|nr:hypothetical protein [Chromatiaceae bacterium]